MKHLKTFNIFESNDLSELEQRDIRKNNEYIDAIKKLKVGFKVNFPSTNKKFMDALMGGLGDNFKLTINDHSFDITKIK